MFADRFGHHQGPEGAVFDQYHAPMVVNQGAPAENQGQVEDRQDFSLVFDDADNQRLEFRDHADGRNRQDVFHLRCR